MKYISHKNISESDCLYLLRKIAACSFLLVIQSLLFPKIDKFFLIILTNNKKKIDYFLKYQVLDDQRNFACYFQNSRFQTIRAKIEKLLISHKIKIRIGRYIQNNKKVCEVYFLQYILCLQYDIIPHRPFFSCSSVTENTSVEFIRLCVIHNSTEFINRIIFIKPKLSFLKVSSKKFTLCL